MIKMARVHIFLVFVVQILITKANESEQTVTSEIKTAETAGENTVVTADDKVVKDYLEAPKDWMDLILGPNSTFIPTASAALMAQVTKSNKTAEEKLTEIKEAATKISNAIESELANLLSFAIGHKDGTEDNKLRKRRSTENPLDSTKLVMRLLKHIKCNNEYQNIAIEKMMTAQEIADKYGIEFTPDTDILSDLAIAANNHASDLTNLLKDACTADESKKEEIEFIPLECDLKSAKPHNHTYYVYTVQPEVHSHYDVHHNHANHYQHNHNVFETQMPKPPMHSAPVTPRPTYHDAMSYPHQEIYCSVEPAMPTTVLLPGEDDFEPEPILTGEEFEETVTSKVFVDHEDKNGETTVNHVMTYTVAEKSHFKKPEIERLPEHMQYCFFLL